MIIKTLAENTSVSDDLGCEHGLSLYIEIKKRKILFDTGASVLFLKNAKQLGANIDEIDYLVISHGHYDHGGGLKTFLQENKKAEVFLHRLAFKKHYALQKDGMPVYIGLEEDLKQNSRFVFTSDRFFISNGIQLFSNVNRKERLPSPNKGLLTEENGVLMEDDFSHEHNMVIEENGKILLVTGCAHNGIVNIMEHFNSIKKRMPDYVIGGFHLSTPSGGDENPAEIERIGKYLLDTKAKFYTCHCTGIEPYKKLKEIMGENIDYISAGSQLVL
jgi:7,8-dihydropterin-6-yl-methyl-4-(beta-D-ribofuranosyl)aminobenzene 5'-phosphate synthase